MTKDLSVERDPDAEMPPGPPGDVRAWNFNGKLPNTHPKFWSPEMKAIMLEAMKVDDIISRIPGMCDWAANFRNVQHAVPDHREYHHGSPCPYGEVVPALLRGQPDPRRS